MKIILKNSNLCFYKNEYIEITSQLDSFEEYQFCKYLSSSSMELTDNYSFCYSVIDINPGEEYILDINTTGHTGGASVGYVISSSEDKTSYTSSSVLFRGTNVDTCRNVQIFVPENAKTMFIQRYMYWNEKHTVISNNIYIVKLYKKEV